jgi:hypothetical protein
MRVLRNPRQQGSWRLLLLLLLLLLHLVTLVRGRACLLLGHVLRLHLPVLLLLHHLVRHLWCLLLVRELWCLLLLLLLLRVVLVCHGC